MSVLPTPLANQLLIALPALSDPTFSRSVALICQHDENGAMGVLVNRPSEYTLGEVLSQMGIDTSDERLREQPVLRGRCTPNVVSSFTTTRAHGIPAWKWARAST